MAADHGRDVDQGRVSVTQNASLALMFDRAAITAHGVVSAVWNPAYDVGYGVGAIGFGILVRQPCCPLQPGSVYLQMACTCMAGESFTMRLLFWSAT